MAVTEINNKMSVGEINNLFKKGGEFHFKKGVYSVYKIPLVLQNNMTVRCDDGVIFEKHVSKPMLQTNYNNSTKAFKGTHDVHWYGGTFIGNTNRALSNMVFIFHAKNIFFEGCTFKNCVALHFIEINASNMVYITRCNFKDHILNKSKQHKESIQIDFANYDGILEGTGKEAMYDGRHCTDIVIQECTFENCRNGVGTHTIAYDPNNDRHHRRIYIEHNKFIGHNLGLGMAVKILNMRYVRVADNEIDGYEKAVYINRMKVGHLPHGGTQENADYTRNIEVEVKRNKITRCLADIDIR